MINISNYLISHYRIIELTHIITSFLKSLVTNNNSWDKVEADMSLKGLSGKNYIHSIGKWENYINYMKGELGI